MTLIIRIAQADGRDEGKSKIGKSSTQCANGGKRATAGEERILGVVGLEYAKREWKLRRMRFGAVLVIYAKLRVTCRPHQTLYQPAS